MLDKAEQFNEEVVDSEAQEFEQVENVDIEANDSHDEQEAEEEITVSIGEESPPQEEEKPAPEWVRDLRKNYRELQREKRELEARLNQRTTEAEKPITLGKKPTLEQFDYDAEKFEESLEEWYEQKRLVSEQQHKVELEQQAQQREWQNRLSAYGEAKQKLKVKDYDEAEYAVQETFSQTMQGIILHGADDPALIVYALGKNPKKAKELAAINDPVKFAIAIGKLETQLKVSNKKSPPPPEKAIRGSGSGSGSVDSTLERLRAEAEKSGNMSKVIAYKQQLRKKST